MQVSKETIASAQAVGVVVRQRRVSQELRQEELALAAGLSERTIHVIERGKPTVSFAAVVAVLAALDLEIVVGLRRPRDNYELARSPSLVHEA